MDVTSWWLYSSLGTPGSLGKAQSAGYRGCCSAEEASEGKTG